MLSVYKNKQVGRAAAILTTGAVATTNVNVPQTLNGKIGVFIQFTLGSLTSCAFNPQVSDDGTTWYDCTDPGTLSLTASGDKFFVVDVAGAKLFRVTATGTGTVTSSSAAITFGYQITGGAIV